MKQSYIFNPFLDGAINGGYWQAVGSSRTLYRLNGTSNMLPLLPPYTTAKVIIIGGSADYPNDAFNSAEVMDIASADINSQWTLLPNFLSFARKNHVCVTLPNDMLFVVGGNLKGLDIDPVLTAELVDTSQTNLTSTMLPAHIYPSSHHLVAILLPNARVWVSGQGGVAQPNQYNIEIYEPGYLFEGDRPVIISPLTNISYGVPFNIETSHPIAAIRLIRFGVVTHSTDMSQLSVGLAHAAGPSNGSYPYTVTPPPNPNIAPPGLYMLFVMRPQSASKSQETMIPSVAKIVMSS